MKKMFVYISVFLTLFVVGGEKESRALGAPKGIDSLKEANGFGGKIKNVRIRARSDSLSAIVTADVDGIDAELLQVSFVEVIFNEPFEGPSPLENPLKLECSERKDPSRKNSPCISYSAEVSFEKSPLDTLHNVSATLSGIDGSVLGDSWKGARHCYEIDDADINIRKPDIKVVNLGNGVFQIIVKQKESDLDKTEYLAINTGGTLRRLRKRPDLLTDEWDELIDQAIDLLKENPLTTPVLTAILGSLNEKERLVEGVINPGDEIVIETAYAAKNSDGKLVFLDSGRVKKTFIVPEVINLENEAFVKSGGNTLRQTILPLDRLGHTVYDNDKPDISAPGVSVASSWNITYDSGGQKVAAIGAHFEGEEVLSCNNEYDPSRPRPRIDYWNCLNDGLSVVEGTNTTTIFFGQAESLKSKTARVLTIPYGPDVQAAGRARWTSLRLKGRGPIMLTGRANYRYVGDNIASLGLTFYYQPGELPIRVAPYKKLALNCKYLGLEPIVFESKRAKREYERSGVCYYNISNFRIVNSDGALSDVHLGSSFNKPAEISANLLFRGNPGGIVDRVDISAQGRRKAPSIQETIKPALIQKEYNRTTFNFAFFNPDGEILSQTPGYTVSAPGSENYFLSVLVDDGDSSPKIKSCEYDHAADKPRVAFYNCLNDGLSLIDNGNNDEVDVSVGVYFEYTSNDKPEVKSCEYDPAADKPRVDFFNCLDNGFAFIDNGSDDEVSASVSVYFKPASNNAPEVKSCEYDPDADKPRVDFFNCLNEGFALIDNGNDDEASASVGVYFKPASNNAPEAKSCEYNPAADKPRVDFYNCLNNSLSLIDSGNADGIHGAITFPRRAVRGDYELILVSYDKMGRPTSSSAGNSIVFRKKGKKGGLRHLPREIRVEVIGRKNAD